MIFIENILKKISTWVKFSFHHYSIASFPKQHTGLSKGAKWALAIGILASLLAIIASFLDLYKHFNPQEKPHQIVKTDETKLSIDGEKHTSNMEKKADKEKGLKKAPHTIPNDKIKPKRFKIKPSRSPKVAPENYRCHERPRNKGGTIPPTEDFWCFLQGNKFVLPDGKIQEILIRVRKGCPIPKGCYKHRR